MVDRIYALLWIAVTWDAPELRRHQHADDDDDGDGSRLNTVAKCNGYSVVAASFILYTILVVSMSTTSFGSNAVCSFSEANKFLNWNGCV